MRIRRTESAISASLLRDEAEISRVTQRFHIHACVIVLGVVMCNVFYAIGVGEQAIAYCTWLLMACQEFTDYSREV